MITRLYYPSALDRLALKAESNNESLRALSPELGTLIDRYHEDFLLKMDAKTTSQKELGEGSIGKAVLFKPEGGLPFVRKGFHTGNEDLTFGGLTPAQMNFFIDLAVMRAMKGLNVAAQIEACSVADTVLINSFKRGWSVASEWATDAMPDAHLQSFVLAMIEMHSRGVTLDTNPTNVLYHPSDGFSVIDALPSSALITPDKDQDVEQIQAQSSEVSEAALDAMFDLDEDGDLDALFKLGVEVEVRRNTYDLTVGEQIFQAAKLSTYALSSDLSGHAQESTADHFLHELAFQRAFLPVLWRVLGIVKIHANTHLSDALERAQAHFELLRHHCHVETGWNAGTFRYSPAEESSSIANDSKIADRIRAINALA